MIDGEPRPGSGTATLRTVPIAIPDPRRRAAAGVDRAPAPRTVPIAFPGHGGRGSAKFTRVPPVYCNTLTYGCFIDNMHALQFTVIEFLMHCTGPGSDFPMHCITAPVDFRYWGNHCSGADRSGLCRADVGCAGRTRSRKGCATRLGGFRAISASPRRRMHQAPGIQPRAAVHCITAPGDFR